MYTLSPNATCEYLFIAASARSRATLAWLMEKAALWS